MEYVQGRDLRAVLRALTDTGRRMKPATAVLIGRQVAQALHYAHTLRDPQDRPFHIVHRDINPTNLVLARSGMVKVLDFGVAKASVYAGKAQTKHPVIKGKLSYLSPEQAQCHELDGRSDVFSLGATLWEMLTGRRLFAGATEFERIRNVLEAPIVSPSAMVPGISPLLDAVVMRALERDPSRRYQNAQAFAEDLDRCLVVAPAGDRAIQDLLEQLFGKASSSSGERLRLGSKSSGRGDSVSASRRTPSASVRSGSRPLRPLARTLSVAWAAVMLVVATVFVAVTASHIVSMLRAGKENVAVAALDVPEIEIEIESDPAGAQVRGSRGKLGTTPLKVTMPSSSGDRAADAGDARLRAHDLRPAAHQERLRVRGAAAGRDAAAAGADAAAGCRQAIALNRRAIAAWAGPGAGGPAPAACLRRQRAKCSTCRRRPKQHQSAAGMAGGNHTTLPDSTARSTLRPNAIFAVRWVFPAPDGPLTSVVGERTVLGRGDDCQTVLAGSGISRYHAEMMRMGPVALVRDLDSMNGLFVNGRRVKEAPLEPGDVVRLGEWVGVALELERGDTAPAIYGTIASGLIGGNTLRAAVEPALRAARSDLPIIVEGETGTGKEVVARAVHEASARSGAFLAVNCAALPEHLAEAELFGYRRGAFTGAERASPGHFRSAQHGTLLLDEIVDLPLAPAGEGAARARAARGGAAGRVAAGAASTCASSSRRRNRWRRRWPTSASAPTCTRAWRA